VTSPSGIDKKRLVQTFIDLIKIDSPSFSEKKIGEYLAGRLARIGFNVEMQRYDKSFNLIAAKKGGKGGTPLILSAHMDTIEPTAGITFAVAKDRIRSTGSTVLGADDKSALAQIIEAMTAASERGVSHCDVEIVFSSAEERGLHGARNLDFCGIRSRHALVLDSSGSVGDIVVGAPTHIRYTMTVTGRSAHAGIEPEKGISAIRVASEIITQVPDGRIDEDTTVNIGVMSGGTATNVVPKEVVIRGELRSHSRKALEKNRALIFGTAKKIAKKRGASIRIEREVEYSSFRIGKGEPFLRFLSDVFRRCGLEPRMKKTGGGSDANVFHRHGIMAVNISNGMQKVHSPEEFILIEDLVKGCEVVLQTVADFGDTPFKA